MTLDEAVLLRLEQTRAHEMIDELERRIAEIEHGLDEAFDGEVPR